MRQQWRYALLVFDLVSTRSINTGTVVSLSTETSMLFQVTKPATLSCLLGWSGRAIVLALLGDPAVQG